MAKSATPARLLALELTKEVRSRDAYIRELVDKARQQNALPAEEFSFAQVLAFGVVMCKGTLDELIDRNLNSPRDIKPKVRDCLRISAYELLFLKKPEHVVVDQGVELVRSVVRRAAGLANAVLRKMARDAAGFPWADASTDAEAFARSFGVPGWLADRFVSQYGWQKAQAVLGASLEGAPTYLHDNPFMEGERFASDLSAVFIAGLIDTSGAVLEIGAGRGTKTLLIQKRAFERCGEQVQIDAVDLHPYRAKLLGERMAENGIESVRTFAGDARNLQAIDGLAAQYRSVFVDAPCSGTGTLRRHPEIRWRLQPGDVDELARLQFELLSEASKRVAPGGQLVYATCSIFAQENEAVIRALLESPLGERFEIEPVPTPSAEQLAAAPGWGVTPEGFFASVPTHGGPDGHFAAVLRRLR